MLDIIFFVGVSLMAALLGAAIVSVARVKFTSRFEEALLYLPLGYLALAYLIALLGLLGLLSRAGGLTALGVALLLGLLGARRVIEAVGQTTERIKRTLMASPNRWLYWFLLLWTATALLTALVRPDNLDWDGVAEHLAMAKLWAQAGQIRPLWFMHHSQFPATVQMLYTLALLFRGPVAAKLFHFAYGIIAVAAVFLLTRRHISRSAAPWAAVVLATTPVYEWLCGVAYVDLAVVAYILLAVHFFLAWVEQRRLMNIILASVLAGAGMAAKMQTLPYFGVLLGIAAYVAVRAPQRQQSQSWRHVALFAVVGTLLASPWYVKSWVITGNPVYPFAYSVFYGKQWSPQQAQWYRRHQQGFGMGELPSPEVMKNLSWWQQRLVGPREPLKLLLAPINLTLRPWEFTVPVGKVAAVARMSIGPLYLMFIPALLIFAPRPPKLKILLIVFLIVWLWWLYSMQLTRYLLPALALLAPAVGYAIRRSIAAGPVLRTLSRITIAVWLATALLFNVLAVTPALPAIFGLTSWDAYLQQNLGVYGPSQYINKFTPPDAKVITYGEPRCFYLDREYLWGDWHYHQMIIYDKMKQSEQLVAAYRRLGITHILINLNFWPDLASSQQPDKRLVREAIGNRELTLVRTLGQQGQYLLLRVPPHRRGQ